ncbi:MAG: hypothetical protein IJ274_05110, partial [Lachnospiraceae bacterium]|nr:hypothetical protein [Lachnospiraceae bacterium]
MRNNEYNPNLKTEYSALQNEYSPAKPEFAFDPIQEYGAGADELKAAEEYEASGETTLEEDTKKRRSFKKRMLKMFTAVAASVVLVVGSGLVASQNNHSNNLKQTDEYNEILDQLLLLAEEERYDEFHEILSSSELEECIQFFETDFYYFEDSVEKTLDGSFWTYDGEYARNSHGVSENHEKEDKLLQVDVFFTEEGYFYSVQHTPTCQSKKKHMDQQGTYEEKYYSYNGEMDEYFAHSGIISGSTTGESLYDIFSRDNSFFERNDEADAALSRRETFWEYWDDGPRGRCTYKEI